MNWQQKIYERALALARSVMERAARSERVQRALRGRRETAGRFENWAASRRDAAKPLFWLHSPSVGEALMAEAIIAALRRSVDCQVAFTFFSPSAERLAERVGADVSAWLPWDLAHDVERALAALKPVVVAFVRTEIWPTLVQHAHEHGARVALINAPLASSSSRLRPLARTFLRPAYASLDAVGAVSAEDAQRFRQLRVAAERTQVTGDARFDQVWSRVAALAAGTPLLTLLRVDARPTIVAGSTWPADDAKLLAAFARVRSRDDVRMIIAPHQPTPVHLAALEQALDATHLTHVRLGVVEAGEAAPAHAVIVVDRVGVLAELYALARVAYVGGGFGRNGLHSVVEPAALGVPVVFGPYHGNAREAAELAAAGGGVAANGVSGIEAGLREYLSHAAAGAAARAWVQSRLGGAERNAALLLSLLPRSGGKRRMETKNRGTGTMMGREASPAINAEQLRQMLDTGEPLVLLDVREPHEWEISNLATYGARLVPMAEIPARISELDPEAATVVYCRTGARSDRVVRFLQANGFTHVFNLEGGINGWAAEIDPEMRRY